MNLKAIREKLRLSQKAIANESGISESYYCLIEKGNRRPSPLVAKKIAEILNIEWTQFYENN